MEVLENIDDSSKSGRPHNVASKFISKKLSQSSKRDSNKNANKSNKVHYE